jgi:hypothetical protein
MRAQLDASLCTPSDNPAGIHVDPTGLTVRLQGKPGVTLSALRVNLPAIDVQATKEGLVLFGLLGARGGGGLLDPAGLLDKLFGGGGLQSVLTVSFGDLLIEADPDKHAIAVEIDLDDASLDAAFQGLKAALQGCLVLNGGEKPAAPIPTATPLKASTRRGTVFTIQGHGFGAVRAPSGAVKFTHDATGSQRDFQVLMWTDTVIHAKVPTSTPTGPGHLFVINSQGVASQPVSFTVTAQ